MFELREGVPAVADLLFAPCGYNDSSGDHDAL